ncbi:NAD-dependent epimerase/dehydratase family protein [Treponema primitia]|uniref:NAD-dependent epimerase/dehydratase family protein n=1 Tax=Treponema primitia TaxID=88058 RepID=UPI0002555019|nr:NAD-dependent epimerase/dehydratase family protein [Treponema primitia]
MSHEIHVVSGATGRTGLALCAELHARGRYVRALYYRGEKVIPFLKQYADEVIFADITLPESIGPALAGASYVYHLAGIVSIASKIDANIRAVNIDGTQNVIDACLASGVKRLVYTGTVHTLPFTDTTSILREIPRFESDAVAGAYAVSKALASNLVLDAVKTRGLDAVIGMPSGIVGGFELKRSNFGQMVVDVAERRLPVYITGRYDFVDVKDVAKALADLADKGVSGESYILSGHTLSVKELVETSARAAGVKPPKLCLPLGFVKLFAGIAENIALRKGQTLMFTPYALKVLGDNCNFSHEKITALTGYAPRPVTDALKDQVEFYFDVYKKIG